ncbi:MAG: hypothetical protein EBW07_12305, partial [Rhodobacteraceae bacterium]|nr:hypothetical protein [Paracoccaceae bacterium]
MVKEDLYEQIMEASSDKVLNQLIANLKKEMSKIDKIDPSSNAYKKMIKFLDATAKVNPQAMKMLADAENGKVPELRDIFGMANSLSMDLGINPEEDFIMEGFFSVIKLGNDTIEN